MTKEQFIKAAKSLGYTDEIIDKIIKLHEEAAANGLKIPWGVDLEALPVTEWLMKYADHFKEEFPILKVRHLNNHEIMKLIQGAIKKNKPYIGTDDL